MRIAEAKAKPNMAQDGVSVRVAILYQPGLEAFADYLSARLNREGLSSQSTTTVNEESLCQAQHLALLLPLSEPQTRALQGLMTKVGRWRLDPQAAHTALFLATKPLRQLDMPGVGAIEIFDRPRFEAALPRLYQSFGPPMPDYASPEAERLGEALEAAQGELDRLVALGEHGLSTDQVVERIVQLKREMRDSGDLVEGIILAGRYRLLVRVGTGGFATVWKAWDRQRERIVALKVLHPQHLYDRTRLERFFQGAEQMAQLEHRNIVEVLDKRVRDGGHQFFVMEFIEGVNLQKRVLEAKFDRRSVLEIILQVGAALNFAHRRGVIHRDIKPGNILIDHRGDVHLTDFDLVWVADSRLELTTGALGTFIYAAPEQMKFGEKVSRRRDVYSLGMTAVFAFYGQLLAPVMLYDRDAFVDQLEIPQAAKVVLKKAISLRVEDRHSGVASFCAELGTAFVEGEYDDGRL